MAGKIVLVTGGARSGKSGFAEKYAAGLGDKVIYIATAQIYDQEMEHRVRLHQERRPADWQTIEAPFAAEKHLAGVSGGQVVLLDCLTIYISNLLLSYDFEQTDAETRHQAVMKAVDRVLAAARASDATVVIVSNEVGMGIVPENALAREFRDLAGKANQKVAAWADEVYLTVSGLAINIKPLALRLPKEV